MFGLENHPGSLQPSPSRSLERPGQRRGRLVPRTTKPSLHHRSSLHLRRNSSRPRLPRSCPSGRPASLIHRPHPEQRLERMRGRHRNPLCHGPCRRLHPNERRTSLGRFLLLIHRLLPRLEQRSFSQSKPLSPCNHQPNQRLPPRRFGQESLRK